MKPAELGASLTLAPGETVVACAMWRGGSGTLIAVTSRGAVWRLDMGIPAWVLYVEGAQSSS
jgi:hypothetical protein